MSGETANVSGWTVDTLRVHILALLEVEKWSRSLFAAIAAVAAIIAILI